MVLPKGIEPLSKAYKAIVLSVKLKKHMVYVVGIAPTIDRLSISSISLIFRLHVHWQ